MGVLEEGVETASWGAHFVGGSSKLGRLNRFATGGLGFAGGLARVRRIGVEWFLVLDDADWIGFDGVLGCFRLSTDLHGCTRILVGGFWIVIGVLWMRCKML